MPSDERSLDYLLPLLSSGSYSSIIKTEASALRSIVRDILSDIQGRKSLEHRLLFALDHHVMRIHSGLMNLRSSYANTSIDAVIGLVAHSIAPDYLFLKRLSGAEYAKPHKPRCPIYRRGRVP